ncbi:MAG: aldo/keto reductase, partial [Acidobacteriota bacterium]|nr:aldo/keto reductase [Acidobacteriota bacterium]
GQVEPQKLLEYSLSLPVSLAVAGMPKLEFIEQNVRWAKAFTPMPKAEMNELSQRLSDKNKTALDSFFANHVDA